MRARKHTPLLSAPNFPDRAELPQFDVREEEAGGLSIWQILSILEAYWKIAAIIAVSIVLVGAVGIKLMPKAYTATATLKVNYEIQDPLAGDAAARQTQAMGYVPTEIQLMHSSEILLPVIERLHLTEDKSYTAGYVGDEAGLRLSIKDRLLRDLDIRQGGQGSFLIYITATAGTPQRAAQIANAVSDSYIERQRHRIDDPAAERAERYTEQLAELKAKVGAAETQLGEFRKRTGMTNPGSQNTSDNDALMNLESRLLTARVTRQELLIRSKADPASNPETTAAHARLQEFRRDVVSLEAQVSQLRQSLGPEHPRIKALQLQIETTRAAMNKELSIFTEGALTDLKQQDLLVQSLEKAVNEQRAKVLGAGTLQDEGHKLVLELESAKSVYARALAGYDQIMFAFRGHYTFVDLVGRAEVPIKSSKPNKLKLLVLVIMAAGGIGGALPLGYELFLNRRVRCRDDLERGFGVPVLIELSPITGRASPA